MLRHSVNRIILRICICNSGVPSDELLQRNYRFDSPPHAAMGRLLIGTPHPRQTLHARLSLRLHQRASNLVIPCHLLAGGADPAAPACVDRARNLRGSPRKAAGGIVRLRMGGLKEYPCGLYSCMAIERPLGSGCLSERNGGLRCCVPGLFE
jgi:hypothetical protein